MNFTPFPRYRPWLTLGGGLGGAMLGAVSGWYAPLPEFQLVWHLCDLLSHVFTAWLQALAAGMIVSGIVLGASGLEPMRALGKLTRKTLGWMAGSSVLAVAVAVTVATVFQQREFLRSETVSPPAGMTESWIVSWLGLVLVSLALGYYRNQLEEGQGRLISRFCQSLEGMLKSAADWTQSLVPIGVFVSAAAGTARLSVEGIAFLSEPTSLLVRVVIIAWLIYAVAVLPLLLVIFTRINPWKIFVPILPAMLTASASRSVEAALPLTLDTVRQRFGVSNRVAAQTTSLCAVLHRDGMALGWTVVALSVLRPAPQDYILLTAAAILTGCGSGALSRDTKGASFLFLSIAGVNVEIALLGALFAVGGAAVSVFSHACAAVIIARSEGEHWVPGPPPPASDLPVAEPFDA